MGKRVFLALALVLVLFSHGLSAEGAPFQAPSKVPPAVKASPSAAASPSIEASPLQEESPSPEASPQEGSLKGRSDDGWIDEAESGSPKDRARQDSLMRRIWLTIFSLIVVSVIIYVMLKFVYARQGIIAGLGSRNKMIRVVERHILQPTKALYLVDVAGRYVLLGITENRIETLMELDADKIKEESAAVQEVSSTGAPFAQHLMALYSKWQQEKKK